MRYTNPLLEPGFFFGGKWDGQILSEKQMRSVCTYVRADGRPDESDVIANPKFLALMGSPKSLINGAPNARSSSIKILMRTHVNIFAEFCNLKQVLKLNRFFKTPQMPSFGP